MAEFARLNSIRQPARKRTRSYFYMAVKNAGVFEGLISLSWFSTTVLRVDYFVAMEYHSGSATHNVLIYRLQGNMKMKGNSAEFERLRNYIESLWVIDSHDHTAVCGPKYTDPLQLIVNGYFPSDIHSATSDAEMAVLNNAELSFDERWPVVEKAWRRARFTGYAEVVKRVLKKFYNIDSVSPETLKKIHGKMIDLEDESVFEGILEEARIVIRLVDIDTAARQVLDGTAAGSPRAVPVISMPPYHGITSYAAVADIAQPLGRTVTSLDEYVDVCLEVFKTLKDFGAVAFKDQSAYIRTLEYGNATRSEAEKVFNWFMEDQRRSASYPDQVKTLGDYLFHTFMRMARDLCLPVQLHTGHMAGIRNEVSKANAIALTSLIELHRDVNFDLFHANWPYSGELLYMCKNFPNVAINFCWTNAIDPIYSQNVLKQAISSVPHGKIHWYGSDFVGCADRAWAHLSIAKDNLAIALSDLVDIDYLALEDAEVIARDLLFNNPNDFYRLGLKYPSN